MKNTIITSISALVFLVIGLFIGKSNNPIEIQTVVKTNIVEKPVDRIVDRIVEKPVIEYIDKYITNVVEKIVEADIPYSYKRAVALKDSLISAKLVEKRKIPFKFDSLDVSVYLSDELKNTVSEESIRNSIELEVRKIGLKINETTPYHLSFSVDVMENKDKTQHFYIYEMKLKHLSYIIEESICTHIVFPSIWEKSGFGTVGINNSASTVKATASECITTFCNKVLESREK